MYSKANIIAFIALVLLGWVAMHPASPQRKPSLTLSGTIAPDFHWSDMDGKIHALSELSGQVVVLHFWASWCAPCRAEFPKLLAAADHMDNKVVFLTVSVDSERATAQQFIHKAQASSGVAPSAHVLYAFDPDKKLSYDVFQTVQYPETVVMDSTHRLRRKFPGPVDWSNADIASYLHHLSE